MEQANFISQGCKLINFKITLVVLQREWTKVVERVGWKTGKEAIDIILMEDEKESVWSLDVSQVESTRSRDGVILETREKKEESVMTLKVSLFAF